MKIILYSDLHLEFGANVSPAPKDDADIMILCGDIIVIENLAPLDRFLHDWRKPVLYVLGNHEYYGRFPIEEAEQILIEHLNQFHPNVKVLRNEAVTIDRVNFFGGTMWTDFDGASEPAMLRARLMMNDYRRISTAGSRRLTPIDTVAMHGAFVGKLEAWFAEPLSGPRVVISHHAPTLNPVSRHKGSELQPAFNSLDMEALILKHQPDVWLYGHTHECDDHVLGTTHILSNQAGYPQGGGIFECPTFDPSGLLIEVG